MPFERDPQHWLLRFSPQEWIRASLREVRQAEQAYRLKNSGAGLAGARRAAGMALNAALIVQPKPTWGRTYVEHLAGLKEDPDVPEAVRAAARLLSDAHPPGSKIVALRSPRGDERVLEAARDVMAHAYWVVKKLGEEED